MSGELTGLGCPQGTARIQVAEPPPRGALEKDSFSWSACRRRSLQVGLPSFPQRACPQAFLPNKFGLHFGPMSRSFWLHFGAIWEPFWSQFGDFWGVRGCGHPSGVLFAPLWLPFRSQGSHLGSVLDPLAPFWPPFWTKWLPFGSHFGSRALILAPFWRLFA